MYLFLLFICSIELPPIIFKLRDMFLLLLRSILDGDQVLSDGGQLGDRGYFSA